MADSDFAELIVPVAKHFWGDHNPKLSSKTEMRWGGQGSRAVFLDGPGNWQNFESGEKGGVIDLVKCEQHTDKQGALQWLQANGYLSATEKPQGRENHSSANTFDAPPDNHPDDDGAVKKDVVGYDYTDADGNKLYQVVRQQWLLPDGSYRLSKHGKPEKTFRQRRKLPNGKVVWNLKGITQTIYRHPHVEIAIEAGAAIFLPEGEKDADTAVALGFEASTNSGGAKNWTPALAALFKGADVVIPVDNDETGIAAGEAKAKSLKGIAKRIRVLNFAEHVPNFPNKHDLTNWVEAGGCAEELQRIVDILPDWTPAPPVSKFGALTLKNIDDEARKHEWLVHDLIEYGGSAAFAGFSKTGKSFLMIELAFSIAMGKPFWGRDVKQGMVVYQLGEGERGFMKRVKGFIQDRDVENPDKVPLVLLPKKINIFTSDDDTNALISEAKAQAEYFEQPLRLIVIDTFNKATRGANEISGLDMGKVIDRIERIAEECQCTVMVVDHLSAQGKFRGHGSKTGDLTNVIMIEADEKKDHNGRTIRRMRLDKNKDGEDGGKIPFVLRQVVVGFDDKGRPITTCVVDKPDGNVDEETKKGRLSLNQALVLQTLRDVVSREGVEPPTGVTGVPNGKKVASWKVFLDELRKKWPHDMENKPADQSRVFKNAIAHAGKALQLAGYIDRDNEASIKEGQKGVIWWTGKDDRAVVSPKPDTPPPLPDDIQQSFGPDPADPPF